MTRSVDEGVPDQPLPEQAEPSSEGVLSDASPAEPPLVLGRGATPTVPTSASRRVRARLARLLPREGAAEGADAAGVGAIAETTAI